MKRGQEFADVWRRRFDEAAQSGTTTINWCRQNGFSVNQYYYWNRRLRELAAESGVSAGPVRPSGSVGISADPYVSIMDETKARWALL